MPDYLINLCLCGIEQGLDVAEQIQSAPSGGNPAVEVVIAQRRAFALKYEFRGAMVGVGTPPLSWVVCRCPAEDVGGGDHSYRAGGERRGFEVGVAVSVEREQRWPAAGRGECGFGEAFLFEVVCQEVDRSGLFKGREDGCPSTEGGDRAGVVFGGGEYYGRPFADGDVIGADRYVAAGEA
ncbi:hypothetical protein [Nocardia tenerifensis]|uniref:hypothetical protein n=1 Tax=Nocardia tenerifensis TaxID=228006 RepID=UPI000592B770|nr:hypothetical protein [Nocardia tenerifensis]